MIHLIAVLPDEYIVRLTEFVQDRNPELQVVGVKPCRAPFLQLRGTPVYTLYGMA